MKKYMSNVFVIFALVLAIAWIALAFAAYRVPSTPEGTAEKMDIALRKRDEKKFLECCSSELRQSYQTMKRRDGLSVWEFFGNNSLENVSDIHMLVIDVEYDDENPDLATVKFIGAERYRNDNIPDLFTLFSIKMIRESDKWVIIEVNRSALN